MSSLPNLLLKHPQSLNHLVLTLREEYLKKKTYPCENTAAAFILTEIVELIGEEKKTKTTTKNTLKRVLTVLLLKCQC